MEVVAFLDSLRRHPQYDGQLQHVETLLNIADIPRSALDCGVEQDMIPMLAGEAAAQWTGTFNPRKLGVHEYESLYHTAMLPRQVYAEKIA